MSSGSTINFAKYSGYESVGAAIVFAVLYTPLLLFFTKRVFSQPTYVLVVMALFCAIRVTAFIIRAVMIKSESAGENLQLLIGDQILFGIGYAGLLYSSYSLVLDLVEEANRRSPRTDEHHILKLLRNRHLFRIAMGAAVALGITSSSMVSSTGTSGTTAITLREAGTGIFLALTALLFIQTVQLARFNLSESRVSYGGVASFGAKHGILILMAISLLLLVREIFITATITPSKHATQLNEHFWYPLVAVPEILAVVLFVTPGLVPTKDELSKSKQSSGQYDPPPS